MAVWIQHIETLVPQHSYSQDYAGHKMQEWTEDERQRRLIAALYRKSGIEKRHSVISSFEDGETGGFFRFGPEGQRLEPGTAWRNEIFGRETRDLSVELARKLVERTPGLATGEITHIITASCTGFTNPGPDYHIVQGLGLPFSTQRFNLGFMGCYAALPALRMAVQFCQADPAATVLVMCLELCTLHLQLRGTEDALLANSLFADGLGAAIVSARPPQGDALRLDGFESTLVPSGEEAMTWTLGDFGFDIALSSYVPKIIGASIGDWVSSALARHGRRPEAVRRWAVHPGGKAIVEKVRDSLALDPEQVRASLAVLRQYGNMSSATILFVLQELLREPAAVQEEESICALAFGPGLTLELALLGAQRAGA
jgi:predicted naringenin-chalcone synthase